MQLGSIHVRYVNEYYSLVLTAGTVHRKSHPCVTGRFLSPRAREPLGGNHSVSAIIATRWAVVKIPAPTPRRVSIKRTVLTERH
jgi:hypothetical protein